MKKEYIVGISVGVVAAVLIVLGVRYTRQVSQSLASGPGSSGSKPTIQFVKNAVPIAEMTFQDLDGRTISTKDWKGKVTLVNFWATWCPPCRVEIPDLIKLQDKYRDQLQVIGISYDEGSVDDVRQFVREQKINYPIVMSTPDLEKGFPGVFALPTTFMLDKEVKTVQKHIGLISPAIYELEARVLAGIPTEVNVEQVEDKGKVLLANAALATEIPGVDLSKLSPQRKTTALKRLNEETCTCGCKLTVAQCRINDTECAISPTIAKKIVEEVSAQ
jgi:thiol-disulfide isomerase/thioredoxin